MLPEPIYRTRSRPMSLLRTLPRAQDNCLVERMKRKSSSLMRIKFEPINILSSSLLQTSCTNLVCTLSTFSEIYVYAFRSKGQNLISCLIVFGTSNKTLWKVIVHLIHNAYQVENGHVHFRATVCASVHLYFNVIMCTGWTGELGRLSSYFDRGIW